MNIEPDFLNHCKTHMLIDITGDSSSPLMLVRLWASCQRELSDVIDSDGLAKLCGYSGSDTALLDILCECGFIEWDGNCFRAHGFLERNKEVLRSEARPESLRERVSSNYAKWRAAVLLRDCYSCVRCGAVEQLHAHHIKPFATCKELRLDVSNGKTLCAACHRNEHRNA